MSQKRSILYEIKTEAEIVSICLNLDEGKRLTVDTSTATKPLVSKWTELDYFQCANCQLAPGTHCPVALGIDQLRQPLNQLISFDQIEVTVRLDDNLTVQTEISAQQVLSSLIGIVIAASYQCIHTRFLWPMVKYHRPFAQQDESVYRSLANIALIYQLTEKEESFEQFILHHYEQLKILNRGLVNRLRDDKGANEVLINGLINLDTFVQEVLFNVRHEFSELSIE